MKDEQKVFIRGVEGRGVEVIKTLTDLGATNPGHCEGEYPTTLYYINHDGFMDYTFPGTEKGQIIMDNYTELHLPEKWKDGDVLVDRHDSQIMALYEFVSDQDADLFNAHILLNGDMIVLHSLEVRKRFRLATAPEIEKFHEILHEHHKDWDAEKKQLVDLKWKPKKGEKCWLVDYYGDINSLTWNDGFVEKKILDFGNYFKTKEEVEAMAEKIKKLLKGEQL